MVDNPNMQILQPLQPSVAPPSDYVLPDRLKHNMAVKRPGKNELFMIRGTSRRDDFGQKLFRLYSPTSRVLLRNMYSRDDLQEHGFIIVATPEE